MSKKKKGGVGTSKEHELFFSKKEEHMYKCHKPRVGY